MSATLSGTLSGTVASLSDQCLGVRHVERTRRKCLVEVGPMPVGNVRWPGSPEQALVSVDSAQGGCDGVAVPTVDDDVA